MCLHFTFRNVCLLEPAFKTLGALKLSFWNIHGWKSRIIGNKFTDTDFLSEIKNSDLIGLGETHLHEGTLEKLSIPGF